MVMNIPELFKHIKTMDESDWQTDGFEVDWKLEIDSQMKIIRLIFEESDGVLDWFHNLFYFTIPYKSKSGKMYNNQESCIKSHIGFARAYKSANDKIMESLINAIDAHPIFKVEIIGWSHGGALSQLAAEDINFRTRKEKK